MVEIKKEILAKIQSETYLTSLVCSPQNNIFFKDLKLDFDNVMCAIIEETFLGAQDKTVRCNSKVDNSISDRFASGRIADRAGAQLAASDTRAAEQMPMPNAMASQIDKPIGLAPALANVNQIVPDSGTAVGFNPSESSVAIGAVRDSIPTSVALQAGQAFAPAYQRLSDMAGLVSTSGRNTLIGRSSSAPSSGVVTVTRKNPTVVNNSKGGDSVTEIGPMAESAGMASTTTPLVTGVDQEKNALNANPASKPFVKDSDSSSGAQINGPRPLYMGGQTGASGSGSGREPANNSGLENASNDSHLNVEVQNKIKQLNSAAQINSFFKNDASKIPNLRTHLYSDATSKLLASKGIRVVNQRGGFSGKRQDEAKFIYSDDGTKFTKLNIVKKN